MGQVYHAMASKSAEEAAASLPLVVHHFQGLQAPHAWTHGSARSLAREV